jgi:type I restriction enzyme, S subunit
VNFNDVCNIVTSGSRGWAEFYSETGPKFIRAQNIRFGRLRLEDLACVSLPKKTEGTRTQVSKGDLLIVITGAGVTNPAMLGHELGEAYVSQHVALIKPTTTSLSRWLLLCLMAPIGARAELVECAYGAGKPGLNLDNIRFLRIPLPPLAEQHRIVDKVDELMALCDRLEAQLTTIHTDSRRLLEAVLHEALKPALLE